MRTKKFVYTMILFILVGIVAIMFFAATSGNIEQRTYAASPEYKEFEYPKYVEYEKVNVDNWDSLVEYLESKKAYEITLTKSIKKESDSYLEPNGNRFYNPIPSVRVKGYKKLHLQDYSIDVSDKSPVFFKKGVDEYRYADCKEHPYRNTLYIIELFAILEIDAGFSEKGSMSFDSHMAYTRPNDYNEQVENVVRDLFYVKGKLVTHTGKFYGGREKKDRLNYYDYTDWEFNTGKVTRAVHGSAVTVGPEGLFVSTGGEYYGYGSHYGGAVAYDEYNAAVKIRKFGRAILERGSFYGRCNAYSIFAEDSGDDIRLRFGSIYMKAASPKDYVCVLKSSQLSDRPCMNLEQPLIAHTMSRTVRGYVVTAQERGDINVHVRGDASNQHYVTDSFETVRIRPISREDKFVYDHRLDQENRMIVSQHEKIIMYIKYEKAAYWLHRAKFLSDNRLDPRVSATGEAAGMIDISYIVLKNLEIIDQKTVSVIYSEYLTYNKELTIKLDTEEWERDAIYTVVVQVKERMGTEIPTVTDSFSVKVVGSDTLLEFTNCSPPSTNATTQLGKRPQNSDLVFSFDYNKSKVPDYFKVVKELAYKDPSGVRSVIYPDASGKFSLKLTQKGYYSITETLRLYSKKTNNLLASKTQNYNVECTVEDYGILAVAEMVKIDNPDPAAQGEVKIVKSGGTPINSARLGDKIYVFTYPNHYCNFVSLAVYEEGTETAVNFNKENDNQYWFTMPSKSVVVKALFKEKEYTITTGDPSNSKPAKTVGSFYYSDGYKIGYNESFGYGKDGYEHVAWVDQRGKRYGLQDTVRARYDVNLTPVHEALVLTFFYYVGDLLVYTDLFTFLNENLELNYNYTVKGEAAFSQFFTTVKLAHWFIDHKSGTVYFDDLTDPNHDIGNENATLIPEHEVRVRSTKTNSVRLRAATEPKEQIKIITVGVPEGKKLKVGENDFLIESKTPGVELYDFKDCLDHPVTQMTLNPQQQKDAGLATQFFSFKARITDNNLVLLKCTVFAWPTFWDEVDEAASFCDKPDCVVKFPSDDETPVLKLDDFYFRIFPTCGKDAHDFPEEGLGPYWCINDGHEYHKCNVCGIVAKTAVEKPETLTIEQLHTLKDYGPKSNSHTEDGHRPYSKCTACGKYFIYTAGEYVERTWEEIVLPKDHTWVMVHGTRTIMGVDFKMHWDECAECGEIDEGSLKLHDMKSLKPAQPGTTRCFECGYEEECEHHYHMETKSEATCQLEGYIDISCNLCGESTGGWNTPKKDHSLVFVPEREPNCQQRGLKAHYRCLDCGQLYLKDIYNGEIEGGNIKELDPEGWRFIILGQKFPEYADGDWEALEDNEEYQNIDTLLNNIYQVELEYRLGGLNDAQLVVSPGVKDPHNHVRELFETRDAIPVTAKTNGYSGDVYCVDCGAKVDDGHDVQCHEHGCVYKNDYVTNETHHWHVCDVYVGKDENDVCNEILDKEEHQFGEWEVYYSVENKSQKVRKCSVCGYEIEEEFDSFTPEERADGRYISVNISEIEADNGIQIQYLVNLANEHNSLIEIKVGAVTIVFDKTAVKEMHSKIQGDGKIILFKLSITREKTEIDEKYKDSNVYMGLEISLDNVKLTEDGKEESLGNLQFVQGKSTVFIDIDSETAKKGNAKVYYLNGETREDMNAVFENGKVKFETSHFSTYVLSFERQQQQQQPPAEKPKLGSGIIAGIVVGCVLFVLVILSGVLILLNKKKIIKINLFDKLFSKKEKAPEVKTEEEKDSETTDSKTDINEKADDSDSQKEISSDEEQK